MAALVADMSEHDGEAAASHFLSGPDLRWEVYEHFNPPNGTGGALLTRGQIAEFADGLRESWKVSDVVPPVGSAGLPAKSTYGVGFGITADDRARESGAKVVIDCASGLISHMVGPSGQ